MLTKNDKKCITYLLTGNTGTDLMEELWEHIDPKYRESLLKDVLVYEQEYDEQLDIDYDVFSSTDNKTIWS